jgi:hypothetical protein
MKLKDSREAYNTYTGTTSEVCRQLSFAAIAVVWVFKIDQPGKPTAVPPALFWPALLAVFSLAFDLLQYLYASVAWGLFNRAKEKELSLSEDAEFDCPKQINWPTIGFFYLKLGCVIACYVLMLIYLFRIIAH